jgi:hypothetical protein
MAGVLSDDDIATFWIRVQINGPDECWPWTAGKTGAGYGAFWLSGKVLQAHRIAYALTHGPIPDGVIIRHKVCDNPPCVNPKHLAPGSHADNKADSTAQNRHLHGERHPMTPLTAADVIALREAHVAGARPGDLARQYGISATAIINILKGRTWRSVTGGVDVHVPWTRNTEAQRRETVRRLHAKGWTQKAIADHMGITQSGVSAIGKAIGAHWLAC